MRAFSKLIWQESQSKENKIIIYNNYDIVSKSKTMPFLIKNYFSFIELFFESFLIVTQLRLLINIRGLFHNIPSTFIQNIELMSIDYQYK